MFCPNIKGKCIGEKCRDWDKEEGDCFVRVVRRTSEVKEMQKTLIEAQRVFAANIAKEAVTQEAQKWVVEAQRYYVLMAKLSLNQLLRDPTLPPETKEIIEQALQAPTAEVAEKLLKDAGLI